MQCHYCHEDDHAFEQCPYSPQEAFQWTIVGNAGAQQPSSSYYFEAVVPSTMVVEEATICDRCNACTHTADECRSKVSFAQQNVFIGLTMRPARIRSLVARSAPTRAARARSATRPRTAGSATAATSLATSSPRAASPSALTATASATLLPTASRPPPTRSPRRATFVARRAM